MNGNANFVFGRLIVPPGYSMEETLRIAEKMESSAKPLWEGNTKESGPPEIERFFFVDRFYVIFGTKKEKIVFLFLFFCVERF